MPSNTSVNVSSSCSARSRRPSPTDRRPTSDTRQKRHRKRIAHRRSLQREHIVLFGRPQYLREAQEIKAERELRVNATDRRPQGPHRSAAGPQHDASARSNRADGKKQMEEVANI